MRHLSFMRVVPALALLLGCPGDTKDSGDSGADSGSDSGADSGSDSGADSGSDSGATGDVAVVVSGAAYIQVGDSAELTATTINATDSSYAWTSSDDLVASVADGLVTAMRPGEVTITATGAESGASGTILLYLANEVPHYDEWLLSAHADYSAEAFNHWNEDDPAEIPTSCARCHSTPGFTDYIGGDGTAADSCDNAAPIGTAIECAACHSDTANELSHVIFPSGVQIDDLGGEARCMTCHQGRESGDGIDETLKEAGATGDLDAVNSSLSFQNIHYYPAAATLYAGEARGGYQYDGQVYDWRFRHVDSNNTCIECHDPHTLEVQLTECAVCHTGVTTLDDLKDIRMMSSAAQDYDGDGNRTEGLYYEIDGLRARLLGTLQAYATEQGAPICYAADAYPYWFNDTTPDGACDESEASYSNAYASWTGRMIQATYNYQMASKDPGGFAHNGKYLIELLYDAIADVDGALGSSSGVDNLVRTDFGHFNGASEAARHWDEDDALSSSCSRCHGGADGYHFYLQYGVGLQEEAQANGLECETCHESIPEFTLITVDSVTFPSEITITDEGNPSNICANCHTGRESWSTVEAAIAAAEAAGSSPSFKNIHYLPAAATKMGTEAEVGVQYDGKEYDGQRTSHLGGEECTDCHAADNTQHTFVVADNFDTCVLCHTTASEVTDIRAGSHNVDYDGDGSASEALEGELDGMAEHLLDALNQAGLAQGVGLCYDANAYPYFFKDTDQSGVCESSEATSSNKYSPWTGPMLRAAFNYQFYAKEPGAWAHNFDYMGQLLYDSTEDLGGNVGSMTRP